MFRNVWCSNEHFKQSVLVFFWLSCLQKSLAEVLAVGDLAPFKTLSVETAVHLSFVWR